MSVSVAIGTRLRALTAGADGYGPRVALFYAGLFIVYGIQVPYLPIWLDFVGLSPGEIGIIIATPFFVRLGLTPVIAWLADRSGRHRRWIVGQAIAATIFVAALTQAQGFWSILALSTALAVALSTIMPLIETIAIEGVREAGLDYGRMRLWGSLTFIGASLVGGWVIDRLGAASCVAMLAAGVAATLLAAGLLPKDRAAPDHDLAEATASPAAAAGMSLAEVVRLLSSPLFLLLLLASGATQASHATFYAFGALHWRAQGLSGTSIGLLWGLGVAAEVALFAISSRVIRRFGVVEVLSVGAVGCVIRWTLMGLDPPLALLVPLQILHALTYGATHLGAIHFIGKAVPRRAAATAQGLYATVAAGVGHGLATLLSGALQGPYGGGAYFAMAGIGTVGLLASLALLRWWDGGSIDGRPLAGPKADPPDGLSPTGREAGDL